MSTGEWSKGLEKGMETDWKNKTGGKQQKTDKETRSEQTLKNSLATLILSII